jgi:hypothetical protein
MSVRSIWSWLVVALTLTTLATGAMTLRPAMASAAVKCADGTTQPTRTDCDIKAQQATTAGKCNGGAFFTFAPWYKYLQNSRYLGPTGSSDTQDTKPCDVNSNFQADLLKPNGPIPLILLAVVDDLLRLAGIAAVIFVLVAGVRYVTSQGKPDATAKAQASLLNAIVGLAISVIAIAIVSFLGAQLGGKTGTTTTGTAVSIESLPHVGATDDLVDKLIGITIGVVGALALLFIVIGGYRYVISQGNPQAVAQAKNTILYALIGLIVAISAQVIVSFVIGKLP